MVTSGAIEALGCSGIVPRSRRRGRRRGPTYLGRSSRSAASRRALVAVTLDEPGSTSRSSSGARGGLRPKLVYTIPITRTRPASASRQAASAARRACAPLRFLMVEDVAYRELGFTTRRCRASGASAPTSSSRRGRPRRPSAPCPAWAGQSARPKCRAAVAAKQLTDQCAGALGQRLFEESARRGWIDEQLIRSRALYRRKGERCCRRWNSHCRRGAVDAARAASSPGSRCGERRPPWRSGRRSTVSPSPGTPSPRRPRRGHLRLSFSLVDVKQIDEGIEARVTPVKRETHYRWDDFAKEPLEA